MPTVRYIAPGLITFLAIFALGLFIFAGGPTMAAGGDGVISGQVVNGTNGGGSVAGLSVQLHTLQNDREPSTSTPNTANTGADGKFEFKGLATSSDYGYYVSLTYQKVDYQSDPVGFASGETSKSLQVTVYDSTTKDPGIRATEADTLLVPHQGNTFLVTEYFNIVNGSDRAYIGSEPAASGGRTKTLSFPLPQGVGNVQFVTGLVDGYAVQDSQGLTDTMAVIPPGREIAFQYVVPFDSTYNFAQTFTVPVDTFYIAVPGNSVIFTGSGLTQHGPVSMPLGDLKAPASTFSLFTAGNITAGQQIVGSFSNISKPVQQGSRGSPWAIVVLGMVVLGSAAGYLVWVRRKRLAMAGAGAVVGAGGVTPVQTDEHEDQLLREIADLDDAFERGDIGESEYQKKRLDKKRLLTDLMQQGERR